MKPSRRDRTPSASRAAQHHRDDGATGKSRRMLSRGARSAQPAGRHQDDGDVDHVGAQGIAKADLRLARRGRPNGDGQLGTRGREGGDRGGNDARERRAARAMPTVPRTNNSPPPPAQVESCQKGQIGPDHRHPQRRKRRPKAATAALPSYPLAPRKALQKMAPMLAAESTRTMAGPPGISAAIDRPRPAAAPTAPMMAAKPPWLRA